MIHRRSIDAGHLNARIVRPGRRSATTVFAAAACRELQNAEAPTKMCPCQDEMAAIRQAIPVVRRFQSRPGSSRNRRQRVDQGLGQAGAGLFFAPTAIADHICGQYKVVHIGRIDSVIEQHFAITGATWGTHPLPSSRSASRHARSSSRIRNRMPAADCLIARLLDCAACAAAPVPFPG